MGQVIPFRRENTFLPEATRTMGEVYDTAVATLSDDTKCVCYVRELVARRIIKAAFAGEVDRDRLRQSGLSGFRWLRYRT
jgi:hypothetical protein